MVDKLTNIMQNQTNNYIFPFLWLHHDDHAKVLANIQVMQEAGIQAFCIESRPHPGFLQDSWWEDLDYILAEAEKRYMQVWILDDSHFPTGYANGKIKSDFPQYQKLFLAINQLDFRGPQQDATILLKYVTPGKRVVLGGSCANDDGHILKVLAAKRTDSQTIDFNTMIDITGHLHGHLLNWDVPDGDWRIFTLVETTQGGEKETEDYLNPLVPEATQVLVNEVYEAHYQHYQHLFGNVIAGFFSDEPRLGNQHGSFSMIGQTEMVLPWRRGMLEEFFADDYLQLPLLSTVHAGGVEKEIRLKYMDIVSRLYGQNFTEVLADWCHDHHVEYIGHLLEDNGAHTRLGYGAGHYFRAIEAQDMAGIDVVLNQVMPGMDHYVNKSMTSAGWDGVFFHYGLGKLGAALGHLDPKKRGRVMSEIFGAYGWSEGLPFMKYLADFMLVRGVNHFVPHAFNPAPFPDPDCPPHFYANGHEPETRFYGKLFKYMNRMADLLSGGQYAVHVAVLYHAELEWLNGPGMPFEEPIRVLMQHQIDCEVTPLDYLLNAEIHQGYFVINGERLTTLVIPSADIIPQKFVAVLKKLHENGVAVIFINNRPTRNERLQSVQHTLTQVGSVVPLEELADALPTSVREITLDQYAPYLRTYRYETGKRNIVFIVNEDPAKTLVTNIQLQIAGVVYQYDGMENELKQVAGQAASHTIPLTLAPSESITLIVGESSQLTELAERQPMMKKAVSKTISLAHWSLAFASAEDYPKFGDAQPLKTLVNVNHLPGQETFAGNMQYSTKVTLSVAPTRADLSLGQVGEIAELRVNGHTIGQKIAPPFTFDHLAQYLHAGENTIVVTVVNNLGIQQQDYLSQYMMIKPAGLLGPVDLKVWE